MKFHPCLLLAAALFAGGCQSTPGNAHPAAAGDITVNFKDPDKFTDVRERLGGGTSQYYLDVLSKHLKETVANRLTAGQMLTVTFTDIDLAGDFLPGRRANMEDVRIIKDIYMPRMDLSFQLRDASGTVIREGERHLTDLNFQQNLSPIDRTQPLFHDKQLLNRWVEQEFKP